MGLNERLANGYQKLKRNRHIVAKNLKLTDEEYRLWDFFIAAYGWDERYSESYGKVLATQREIAQILAWSASKVNRVLTKLKKKGLIESTGQSKYEVLKGVKTQEEVASVKQAVAPAVYPVAVMEQEKPQKTLTPLVSSKVTSSLLRSDEEYDLLHQEFPGFEVDDLKWIDENVKGYNN